MAIQENNTPKSLLECLGGRKLIETIENDMDDWEWKDLAGVQITKESFRYLQLHIKYQNNDGLKSLEYSFRDGRWFKIEH